RVHDPADVPELRAELVRERSARRLVVGEELVAERFARRVEHDGEVVRMLLAEELGEHVREAVDGVGWQPARGAEPGERMEGAEDVPAGVDQVEARQGARRGGSHLPRPDASRGVPVCPIPRRPLAMSRARRYMTPPNFPGVSESNASWMIEV